MAAIAHDVVDVVRNDYALGPSRKIMIERFEGCAAANSAFAKEVALVLFCLAVHGKIGVSGRFVFIDEPRNVFKPSSPLR